MLSRTRGAGLAAIGAAVLTLSACDLFGSDDGASSGASPSPTAVDAAASAPEASPDAGAAAAEPSTSPSAEPSGDSDDEILPNASARIVLGDMDVYTTSNLRCEVAPDSMSFGAELDGPHRGGTVLDGRFGIVGEPDAVGLMMDGGQASFPFWVVQDEHSAGRALGEFGDVSFDPGNRHAQGTASFEAVERDGETLTDPPTFVEGTFEIRC